jgi:hypothetical protein
MEHLWYGVYRGNPMHFLLGEKPVPALCQVSLRIRRFFLFSIISPIPHNHHHHKDQGLGHSARSVSRVTAALDSVSSVSQLFSFLVDCSGMILKGFGVMAFFAGVRASSFCIHLFCLVCIQSVVRGVWSRWSYGH